MITKRARVWLSRGIALTVMLVMVVAAGATWFYAGHIATELLTIESPDPVPDTTVLGVGPRSVTLPANPETTAPGTWGLRYEGGFAEIGDVIGSGDGTVTRELRSASGILAAGTVVAIDRVVGEDPSDLRIDYDDVLLEGPLGDYPAWLVDGRKTTWVIIVHDRGTDRRDALRLIPALAEDLLPSLAITYRNDVSAPAGGGGHAGLGRNEWDDLDAAVTYAVDEGATQVVLVGYGVGGSIIEVFMNHSRQAERVVGIVLDAPLLDPSERVDAMASVDKVPGFIVGWAKSTATLRFGIDWTDLDHLSRAAETAVPTLIIHGDADDRYPIEASRAFAAAAPYYVDLVEVPGAGHGESWNLDPDAYEAEVVGFIDEVVAAAASAGGN